MKLCRRVIEKKSLTRGKGPTEVRLGLATQEKFLESRHSLTAKPATNFPHPRLVGGVDPGGLVLKSTQNEVDPFEVDWFHDPSIETAIDVFLHVFLHQGC